MKALHSNPRIIIGAVLVSCLVFAASLLGGLAAARHVSPQFRPLTYPQHQSSAVVRVGDPIDLTVTKCNSFHAVLQYTSASAWVSVVPAGLIIANATIAATAQPGCVTKTVQSVMPPAVIGQTQELLKSGFTSVTWRISYVSTPEGHKNPATSSWTTDPIVVTGP